MANFMQAETQLTSGIVLVSLAAALGLIGMSGLIPPVAGSIGAVLVVVGGVRKLF